MLKVYTDIELLNDGNRSYVFPLLFDLVYAKHSVLSECYKIQNTVKDSDIAIWPLEYGFSKKYLNIKLVHFLELARQAKKIIWIYSGGDYGYTLNDHTIYNFRLGGFKSKLNSKSVMLPSFIDDPFIEKISNPSIPVKKSLNPKIGFVGHAANSLGQYLKELTNYVKINFRRLVQTEFTDFQPFYPSSVKRSRRLQQLILNKNIDDNFIYRKRYRAGVKTETERIKTTQEFYQNIYENAYTFCMRGNGNFSVRLYETLAVGRIPVLLDTDCKLPLDELVDWRKHVVWIENSDKQKIADKLLEFHNTISEREFILLQERNRQLWSEYLTRHGFFKQIHDMFINII